MRKKLRNSSKLSLDVIEQSITEIMTSIINVIAIRENIYRSQK